MKKQKYYNRICPNCLNRKMKGYDHYTYKGVIKLRFKCCKCGKITANPLRRMPNKQTLKETLL